MYETNCKNCGGLLKESANKEHLICEFCNSTYPNLHKAKKPVLLVSVFFLLICMVVALGFFYFKPSSALEPAFHLYKDLPGDAGAKIPIKLVKDFIGYMLATNQTEMKNLVSPKFIKENDVFYNRLKINSFTASDYKILSYENGIVTALLGSRSHSQVFWYKVQFLIVKEKGNLYILPSEKKWGGYSDPWISFSHYKTESE
ncbi:MAG: hypothetical protein H7A25_14395 [Leptospiraceae bacterium]|nr:hypothetical protein [Leptospiraceae bacterium]